MKKNHNKNSEYKKIFFIGIIFGFFLKLFVIDIIHVSGNSMQDEIQNGQIVILNKLAFGIKNPFKDSYFFRWKNPKNGDIVTFKKDNKLVIKRCVFTSGDIIEISKDSDYYLNINGEKIPLTKEQFKNLQGIQKIPQGFIFVLGDNRDSSIDSRDYGLVSRESLTGKIIFY